MGYFCFFNTDTAAKFKCEGCEKKFKRIHGCKENIKKEYVVAFDCPICDGKADKCGIKIGKKFKCYHKKGDAVLFKRCPRSYLTRDAMKLIPYFFDWLNDKTWPDHRSRMKQPIKLQIAFGVLAKIYNELRDKEQAKGK